MGRGRSQPPQDGAWFALGPLLALRQSTPSQRGRRQAGSGFSAARAGRAHQPDTLSLNHSRYALATTGSTGLAPCRAAVASCDWSPVARRSRFAWTCGRSRRPGCHGRWRLVVRRTHWATGIGRPTDDPHTSPPPTPLIPLVLVDLTSRLAARCKTRQASFQFAQRQGALGRCSGTPHNGARREDVGTY